MNDIDKYKLNYEYLRRSKGFRKYCVSMRAPGSISSNIETQLKFFGTYFASGDIFVNSFEVSYQRYKNNRNSNKKEPVHNLGEIFRESARDVIRSYKKKHGKNLTLGQFVAYFEKRFKQGAIYLKIDVTNGSEVEILKYVKRIVRQRKKEEGVKNIITLKNRNTRVKKKGFRVEDLKKYLEVYDLRSKPKSKTTEEVVKAIGTPADIEALRRDNERRDDVLRKYKLYYANAKRIIENAEIGDFPGSY